MPIVSPDQARQGYTLLAVNRQGDSTNLTPLVKQLTWEGSLQGAAMKVSVDLIPYPGLGDLVTYGDQLILFGYLPEQGRTAEILRGYVFERERTAGTSGGMRLTAYDMLIYLLENENDYIFRDMKASTIITTVCETLGIPTGVIADTEYSIPKLIGRQMQPYDLFIKALIMTREATGQKYFLRAREGRILLVPRPVTPETWVLQTESTLLSVTHTESIQGLRNRVVVMANATDEQRAPILAVAEDLASVDAYGLLQQVERVDGNASGKPDASIVARNLLAKLNKVERTARVSALAVNNLLPGDPIIVEEPSTGISGGYYVKEVSVSVSGTQATMDVTLAQDDAYEADENGGES